MCITSLIPPAAKDGKAGTVRSSKVAVDRVFFKRLGKILRILIPSVKSTEFAYIVVLTVLLFGEYCLIRSSCPSLHVCIARTILSVVIAEIAGRNAQFLVSRRWKEMLNVRNPLHLSLPLVMFLLRVCASLRS